MKKILVISSVTKSLINFRLEMMKRFQELGYDVTAIGNQKKKDFESILKKENIKYKVLEVNRTGMNPFSDLKTLIQLTKILKKEKPYKVFLYNPKTVIYGCLAAKFNRIEEVYALIAGLGSIIRDKPSTLKRKIVRKIMMSEYRIALKSARKVLFQNKDDMQTFVDLGLVKDSKCCIVNGSGVDLKEFPEGKLPDQPAFLMVGRLLRDKGIIEYLKACRIMKEKYPSCRCMLVGPFDTNPSAISEQDLEPYIKDGVIEYFGYQQDVRPFFKQCSVYVLPSYHEGTPRSVLEAMSMGRAVITTDAPGCRETVIDGENGYLIPVKNEKELAEKMERLFNDARLVEGMGKKSRQIAEKKYDVHKVNQSIVEIMEL